MRLFAVSWNGRPFPNFLTRMILDFWMSEENQIPFCRLRLTSSLETFAGEIVQGIDGYDPFKLYEDLLLAENEKASMIREDIQPADLSKIRCNAEDKNKRGVDKENKLNDVYENKYRIPLDYEILKDDGVFLPRALSDKLLFELRLAPVGSVVIRSNEALTLTNIQHEYEVIHSQELADEALSNYEMERDQCRSK